MMEKMRWIIVLAVLIMGVVGCGTYRLESPTVSGSTSPDAIPIYVGPYRVHDTAAPLATPAEWDRDLYIKQAITARMKARFVDNPATAKVTIKTAAFEIGHVMKVHCSSTTMFNGLEIKTLVVKPDVFTIGHSEEAYLSLARGDAELITITLEEILAGKNLHKAESLIRLKKDLAYGGLEEIQIK